MNLLEKLGASFRTSEVTKAVVLGAILGFGPLLNDIENIPGVIERYQCRQRFSKNREYLERVPATTYSASFSIDK
jgi:hypothetical protein